MQAKTILGVALLVLFTLACGGTTAEWPPDLSPKEQDGDPNVQRLAEGIDEVVSLRLDRETLWASGTVGDNGNVVVSIPTTATSPPEVFGQHRAWLLAPTRQGLWEAGLMTDVRFTPHDGLTTTIGEGNVRGLHGADRWACVVWYEETEGVTHIEARHDDQPRLQHFERAVKGEPLWDPNNGAVLARPDGSCVVAMTNGIHIYENDGSSRQLPEIASPVGSDGMTTYWTSQKGTWMLTSEEDKLTRLTDQKVQLVVGNWGYRPVEEDYTNPTTIPGMGQVSKLTVGIERVPLSESGGGAESLLTTPIQQEDALGAFTVEEGFLYWASNRGFVARKALPADPEPTAAAPKDQ